MKKAIDFYLLATQLKYKIRSGWDEMHWNVDKERLESVAEHVYGACILAISIDSEFNLNLDLDKVLRMLVLHEIGEVLIGDITPFDGVTRREKMTLEHEAIRRSFGGLAKKEEYCRLLAEFDEHETRESRFAYYCDKFESDLQAKVYQDMGCCRSLDDQDNNVVLKNEIIQKILADESINSVFDVWYEWGKGIYEDELFPVFLEYIKTNNLTFRENNAVS